ncbi:MAG: hypothetical protein IJ190_03960 [Prevotella sp.]|nr:hypothetical protein [Prevotella sp.]
MMKSLNIEAINLHSPYIVGYDGKAFIFVTDSGITYRVDFEQDNNPFFVAYWFNLANPDNMKSPNDIKIAQTVICIIEEFFSVNPEVLLYMCSTDNSQQAQRARLFLRWFNGYEQQKRYVIKSSEVRGEDANGKPITEYVALIVQRTHPQLEEIVYHFNCEIAMFNEFKP